MTLSVVAALDAELAEIRLRDEALAGSTLAATAYRLAEQLDAGNSATSKAMCAKALADVMDAIHERAPKLSEGNKLDELNARREQRRAVARGAAPADSASS